MPCWNRCAEKVLFFYEIYQKLKQINFKITTEVDSEEILNRFRKRFFSVNVKLWNGEMIPIEIEENDHLFDIRYQVSEKAHIHFSDVTTDL
ncbi:hypothetical protein M9Y10_028455 [Tritrichomonas musculus]|uniref:Uncharacterized protein n=1 Tax=Tritrichomonas musculus TaxID=1915356 RepID=A0ABR2KJA8_9EUKA